MIYNIDITSFNIMEKTAHALALALPSQGIITLKGDMGSGKTTFIKSLISSLSTLQKVPCPLVTSPTFSLIHEYHIGSLTIAHCDLFRLNNQQDLEAIGLEAYLDDALCFIEWPDIAHNFLTDIMIFCEFFTKNDQRCLTINVNKRYSLSINFE